MPLTLPYSIDPAADINAEPLQANFQAIVDRFSGGIVDADCSILMALLGSKIAANTLPGDRILSGTITQLQMGANSVGSTQIIALAVEKTHMTTTVGKKITKSQLELKVLTGTLAFTQSIIITPLLYWHDIGQAVVGGVNSWVVNVRRVQTGGAVQELRTLTPGAAIPVVSTTPIAVIFKNPTLAVNTGTVDVEFYYLENS